MRAMALRLADIAGRTIAHLLAEDREEKPFVGTKQNPGRFDCYANAKPDEPMFVLLARDPIAPVLVRIWVTLRHHCGLGNLQKDGEALQCAQDMEVWRLRNYKPKTRGETIAHYAERVVENASPIENADTGIPGYWVDAEELTLLREKLREIGQR